MDFDTDLWSEIEDMPGEIFDMNDESIDQLLDEGKPKKFNFDAYLNANYDY
jgi:hypothetical protein